MILQRKRLPVVRCSVWLGRKFVELIKIAFDNVMGGFVISVALLMKSALGFSHWSFIRQVEFFSVYLVIFLPITIQANLVCLAQKSPNAIHGVPNIWFSLVVKCENTMLWKCRYLLSDEGPKCIFGSLNAV